MKAARAETAKSESWRIPKADVTRLDIAFPASVVDLMPPYEEIPKEFRDFNSGTKWNQLFNELFYVGVKNLKCVAKSGINQEHARNTLLMIRGSFEPKHEHKEAAFAYLCSLWFEDATWEKAK